MDFQKEISVQTYGSYKHLKGEFDEFKVYFTDSNRTFAQDNGIYKKHTHVVYEVILIEKGIYRCAVNDVKLELNEWDLLVIQPGQQHEDFLQKGTIWYAFHFWISTEEHLSSLIFEKEVRPQDQVIHIIEKEREFFVSMIKLFEMETKNNEYESYMIHSSMFKAIFHKILTLFPKQLLAEQFTDHHSMNQEAARIKTIFHRNLSRQPTLQDLCRQTAMSRSALYRACQQHFNLAPRKAFLHYKMNYIYDFIKENPDIRVKELSSIFGFKTQFHFSRLFTQEMGCYPSFISRQRK